MAEQQTENGVIRELADRLVNLKIPNPLAAGPEHDIEASGVYDWDELQRLAAAILTVIPPVKTGAPDA